MQVVVKPVRVSGLRVHSVLPLIAWLGASPAPGQAMTPVVFVHGAYAAGDSWATQVQRFASNGYEGAALFAFDYDGVNPRHATDALDAFVRSVLARTGRQRVHLVAHSRGTVEAYAFLGSPDRRALVERYVHAGGFRASGPAGPAADPVPMLNLWSDADVAFGEVGEIAGATNVRLSGLDHLQVGLGPAAFRELYTFLVGSSPATTTVLPDSERRIAGRAIALATNEPLPFAGVEIWRVDPVTSQRAERVGQFTADVGGRWGPCRVGAGDYHELVLTTARPSDRRVHVFREPFVRSNELVYLRQFRPVADLAGLQLMPSDERPVHVSLSYGRAIVSGRDSFTLNGLELAIAPLAPPGKLLVAPIAWDLDDDGLSDVTPLLQLQRPPFFQGVDVALLPGVLTVALNGRVLRARAIPSRSGVTMTQFD